jgi:hypothetical protein
MTENGMQLHPPQRLDEWLNQHDNIYFPPFDVDNGEKSYAERYSGFANELLSIHNHVEKGAMVAGALEWMEKTREIAEEEATEERKSLLRKLQDAAPIVHLNIHGKGHVDKVIQKVSELLHFFERGYLTPYEGFFLLCAVQLHDTGNMYGRAKHEKEARKILVEKGKPFIPDAFERKLIEKIALVHGGAYDGDCDTIRHLAVQKQLHDRDIRKQLLAALLRFGDELADDHSRADTAGLESGTIIPECIIYHRYSQALHTVKIKRNSENDAVELSLCYEHLCPVSATADTRRLRLNGF